MNPTGCSAVCRMARRSRDWTRRRMDCEHSVGTPMAVGSVTESQAVADDRRWTVDAAARMEWTVARAIAAERNGWLGVQPSMTVDGIEGTPG